jgi:hypothetical protein
MIGRIFVPDRPSRTDRIRYRLIRLRGSYLETGAGTATVS